MKLKHLGRSLISRFGGMLAVLSLVSVLVLMLVLVVLLVLSVLGAPGIGPWHHSYGWGPSGGTALLVIILLVVLLSQRN